jgi:hypothetical protein
MKATNYVMERREKVEMMLMNMSYNGQMEVKSISEWHKEYLESKSIFSFDDWKFLVPTKLITIIQPGYKDVPAKTIQVWE